MKARVILPPLVKCAYILIPVYTVLLVLHLAIFVVCNFSSLLFSIEDAEVADDAEASEFWGYFGGFGTISAKTGHGDSREEGPSAQLFK